MSVRENRREEAVDRIADHLVANGLGASSLRSLAEAARTSDRMLMYYFVNKDDIIVAALKAIAHRLATALFSLAPSGVARDPETILHELAPILRGPELRPYMRVWLELATLAAFGKEPYRATAGAIADGFVAWVAGRLDPKTVGDPNAEAARIVATLDGLVLLDCVGREQTASTALKWRGAPSDNLPNAPDALPS